MAAIGSQAGGVREMPRIAAVLLLAFVGVLWAGVLVKQRFPDLQNTLGQGIGITGVTFITPVALVAAVGLWLRQTWAWWFGLVVVGWQAVSYLLFLMVVVASGDITGPLTWLTGLWLLATLIAIVLPRTRRACLRAPQA